jgi:predicted NBD/HSP70 family sugar kinase
VKPRSIVGVDIGGTKTAVVEGTDDGRIIRRIQFATAPERGFDSVFNDIVCGIEEHRQHMLSWPSVWLWVGRWMFFKA